MTKSTHHAAIPVMRDIDEVGIDGVTYTGAQLRALIHATHPATPTPTDLPEALRLADALQTNYFCGKQGPEVWDAAAAELRRLHAALAAPTTEQSSEVAQAGAPADMEDEQCRCEPSEWVPPRGYDGDGSVAAMARRAAQPQAGAPARDLQAVITAAAEKLDAAKRCHVNAVGALVDEALEILDGDREPAPQAGAESYPPIDRKEFGSDSDLWAYIDAWHHASAGASAGEKAQWIEKHIQGLMRAYADATAALRARGAVPTNQQLCEMAYLLQITPRGEQVPYQFLQVLRRQFVAALTAYAAPAAPMSAPVEPIAFEALHPNGQKTWGDRLGIADVLRENGCTIRYLVEAAAPQPPAALPGEQDADPLQGAANWLVQAHVALETSTLAGKLSIGYNRAERLHAAAMAAKGRTDGGAA